MHALDELSYRQFIPQFELLGCRLRIHSKSNKNFIPIVSKLRRSSTKLQFWKTISLNLNSSGKLFIFNEDHSLLNAISLSSLKFTDIRPVHHSVFSIPHILVIHPQSLSPTLLVGPSSISYSPSSTTSSASTTTSHSSSFNLLSNLRPTSPKSSQRLSPTGNSSQKDVFTSDEPLFIAFNSRRHMLAWLTLLRSCTKPEISVAGNNGDAGLFRMSRQLSVTIIELRSPQKFDPVSAFNKLTIDSHNIGANNDNFLSNSTPTLQRRSSTQFTENSETYEWFCEIFDPTGLAWKSSLKVGQHPFWKEECLLVDLPNLNSITIKIYKSVITNGVNKNQCSLFGTVFIPLKAYQRSTDVEKWFNVIGVNDTTLETSIRGELRLNLRVDEDVILPKNYYDELYNLMQSNNRINIINDLSNLYPSLDQFSDTLIKIHSCNGDLLVKIIKDLATREIWSSRADENTIFRPNTILTKMMDRYMNFMSTLTGWLENSLGEPIRDMMEKKVECELDTDRKGGPADKDELLYWADVVLNSIIESRVGCPLELRRIFQHIRRQCHKRWGKAQLVNSFIFLRLFVPAIINPNLFSLTNVSPSPQVSRTLTLIAKIIQALANDKEELGDKEHFMGVVSPFLQDRNRRFAFMDYVAYVGNEDSAPSYITSEEISINQLTNLVEKAANERFNSYDHEIYRESLPNASTGIDYPRSMATFSTDLSKIYNQIRLDELHGCNDNKKIFDNLDLSTRELFEVSSNIEEEAQALWESCQRSKRKAAYEIANTNNVDYNYDSSFNSDDHFNLNDNLSVNNNNSSSNSNNNNSNNTNNNILNNDSNNNNHNNSTYINNNKNKNNNKRNQNARTASVSTKYNSNFNFQSNNYINQQQQRQQQQSTPTSSRKRGFTITGLSGQYQRYNKTTNSDWSANTATPSSYYYYYHNRNDRDKRASSPNAKEKYRRFDRKGSRGTFDKDEIEKIESLRPSIGDRSKSRSSIRSSYQKMSEINNNKSKDDLYLSSNNNTNQNESSNSSNSSNKRMNVFMKWSQKFNSHQHQNDSQ